MPCLLYTWAFLFSVLVMFNFGWGKENPLWKIFTEKNRYTREDARISWKECSLSVNERLDCGFYGVSEEQCYSRECCWGESATEGVPWCYHSRPTIKKYCSASPDEKVECGFYGIRKEQCTALDCCWQPSPKQEAPWCYHTIRVPVYEGECGVPVIPPIVQSRVVGGAEAKPHSWPWMASLQAISMQSHRCGGSLINNQWVLSAAHCQSPIDDTSIMLGLHSQSEPDQPQQSFGVKKMIPHELYGTQGYYGLAYDIMLIKLDRPVEFNDYISPVCLIEPDTDIESGRHTYVAGWGTMRLEGEVPDKLQQGMIPIWSNEQCNKNDSYNGLVDDTMLCAGFEEGGRAACHGDSGGPLVLYEDDHWTLVGVVSWVGLELSHKCAGSDIPTVYCRVSKFINWIEKTIVEHSG